MHLQTVVLFKEAVNMAFVGLYGCLEPQHLGTELWSKTGQEERAFIEKHMGQSLFLKRKAIQIQWIAPLAFKTFKIWCSYIYIYI